eukprot:10512157-Alexandrium_andersonii.AAC.1
MEGAIRELAEQVAQSRKETQESHATLARDIKSQVDTIASAFQQEKEKNEKRFEAIEGKLKELTDKLGEVSMAPSSTASDATMTTAESGRAVKRRLGDAAASAVAESGEDADPCRVWV